MKKTYFKTILALIATVTILAACESEDGPKELIKPPTKAEFAALRAKALENITQTTTFKAEDGLTFESKHGAKLVLSPNCLMDEEGNPVTGNVDMTYIEIYDKGNMALTNKPVVAFDPASGHPVPLITGGQYFIEMKQGNKKLTSICLYSITIPGSLTGGVDEEMVLWNGIIDEETGNLVYEEAVEEQGGLKIEMANYSIFRDRFDWTNIDKFWNFTGPKTQIKVTVPEGYNGDNAALYVVFDDEPNALAQLDVYDKTEKYFTEHYGFLPVGKKVHLVFVSESNGAVAYVVKPVTIEANQTITISADELKVGTLDSVAALIKGLS